MITLALSIFFQCSYLSQPKVQIAVRVASIHQMVSKINENPIDFEKFVKERVDAQERIIDLIDINIEKAKARNDNKTVATLLQQRLKKEMRLHLLKTGIYTVPKK
jgi:DNA-binding ferritin-like protein